MLPELRVGLYTALKTIHSDIYFVEVPSNQTLPYFVFTPFTSGVRWDTMHKDEEQYIQINGYGKSLQELEGIKEEIRELLDNNPGAIELDPPFSVYDIAEQLNRTAKLGDIWQFTLQYKITIQKT